MVSDKRIQRPACQHCGARAWVDGQCLRCGKPASPATEATPPAKERGAPANFSRPAMLLLAVLVLMGMVAVVVPTVLGLLTPQPIVLFVLILIGFAVMTKLRSKRG